MGRSKTEAIDPAEQRYEEILAAEAETWCIEDEYKRHEKLQRERIRHPKLIRDLQLDKLDTHLMDILEIGGGPSPVTDLLEYESRVVVDPCTDEYARYFPVIESEQFNMKVEEMGDDWEERFDLIVCTNALDHVYCPVMAVDRIRAMCRPGGFVAIMCAENNALTNPHPCHINNLTAKDLHRWMDAEFETVWELTFSKDRYRYGWVEYQGKRGQPAFALLFRKCSGYS